MKITKTLPTGKLPEIQKTVPEVFILESLSFEDEEDQLYEGKILCDILRMCDKKPKYFYFRTDTELRELVTLFRRSQYRYLHISAHGSATGISTTLGEISWADFATIFEGHLKNRRLFISACSVGNATFGESVHACNKGMYSIAAPVDDIEFRHAAAFWTALYVQLFTQNEKSMKSCNIGYSLQQLCNLFNLRFFWSYHGKGWITKTIEPEVKANGISS